MEASYTVILSAITGGILSLTTTYIITRINNKKESKRWDSETAIKFVDFAIHNPELARKVSKQFCVALLIHFDKDGISDKYFLPAFCRYSVGRNEDNDIKIEDPYLSRDQGLFWYSRGSIFYKDISPTNPTLLNGKEIHGKVKLCSGNILTFGKSTLKFEKI